MEVLFNVYQGEISVKPISRLFKDIVIGKRDSMERPVDGMITFLNINQGGNWRYNRDSDHYEDRLSGRTNKSTDIKHRL